MIIGIVGARRTDNLKKVWDKINEITKKYKQFEIVTGDATGVDEIARSFAKKNTIFQ